MLGVGVRKHLEGFNHPTSWTCGGGGQQLFSHTRAPKILQVKSSTNCWPLEGRFSGQDPSSTLSHALKFGGGWEGLETLRKHQMTTLCCHRVTACCFIELSSWNHNLEPIVLVKVMLLNTSLGVLQVGETTKGREVHFDFLQGQRSWPNWIQQEKWSDGIYLLMGIVKPGPFQAQEFYSKAGACSPPEMLHSPFGEDTHLNLTTRRVKVSLSEV